MTTKPEWERLAEALMDQNWSAHDWRAAALLRQQAEQLKAITHLVTQLHQAKGRYHTQLATCALFDAFGLPNVKPERKVK